MSGGAPVIELRSVRRVFAGATDVVALDDVDLRVVAGDQLAVVGPSGSGKSTLLNVLGCLDRPTSGTYLLDGTDVGELDDRAMARLRCERIGFVFQSFHLLDHLSIEANVALGELYDRRRLSSRHERRARLDRAAESLGRVGLADRIGFRPTQLSGGERQRVAIARALVGSPTLLLCDEPTGNLDSENTAAVLDLFDELRGDGFAMVIITHDPIVAARATRRVTMRDGRVREERRDAAA